VSWERDPETSPMTSIPDSVGIGEDGALQDLYLRDELSSSSTMCEGWGWKAYGSI
jgi:hypothetical protein